MISQFPKQPPKLLATAQQTEALPPPALPRVGLRFRLEFKPGPKIAAHYRIPGPYFEPGAFIRWDSPLRLIEEHAHVEFMAWPTSGATTPDQCM